jgi:hypothetical protein
MGNANMKKRSFLVAAGAATLLCRQACAAQASARAPAPGPALLTVTGAVSRINRPPLDPALDQLMLRQKLGFERAHAFDFAALTALPTQTIKPTLEYDAQPHTLSGPLLVDVLQAAGAQAGSAGSLLLRAIDGYAVTLELAEARRRRFIVATHLDGKPMPLGGLGPLWAIHDADRDPEMAARPLDQRFGLCPWALYHINVQE